MSRPVAAWGDAPTPSEAAAKCTDPDCPDCLVIRFVLDAGARVICEAAGGDFDAIRDPHTVLHYRKIADDVFSAMSAGVAALATVSAGDPT